MEGRKGVAGEHFSVARIWPPICLDSYACINVPQKLANKTYNKLAPSNEDGENGEDEKGKSKVPNLNRLIKSRLQKLVDKTDPSYVSLLFSRFFGSLAS